MKQSDAERIIGLADESTPLGKAARFILGRYLSARALNKAVIEELRQLTKRNDGKDA